MNKNENPHFSVLMSVYCKEEPKFLELAFESIFIKQTILPNEVVLVEDGPLTDELIQVIDKYQKKFPKILKIYPLKKNGGLGKALQYGLEQCTNELIMRMDTDDICVANRFEKQLEYMKSHPDVSVVGGNILEFKNSLKEDMRLKEMPITYDDVLKYAKFRNPLNHMTVCFRKSDILEVGNYQPLFYLEDHYLWARLLVNHKKIENIPEALVYARIGSGFEERRGNKNYIASWKVLQKYLYDNKFLNWFQKIRNLLGMYVFIYAPKNARKIFYNKLLRKN